MLNTTVHWPTDTTTTSTTVSEFASDSTINF
jgi:hypothetical protein